MKDLSAFIRKEFLHIFRDTRTLMVLIGMPVVLITLFGFALSVEIKNIDVGVLAPRQDELITHLINQIDANEIFSVKKYLSSYKELDEEIRSSNIDLALVFDNNFNAEIMDNEGAHISIIVDASNPNAAASETMYIMNIIQSYFRDKMPSTQNNIINTNIRMLYNPQLKSSYNFVPGIMGLVLILVCALMTSVSIVREKETGTMEVLLVSPVKPITIILSKMIPYLVVSLVVLIIVLTLSFTVLQVPLAGSLFWVVITSILYIILSLGIGLLVSTLVKTQIAASIITGVVFMLPIVMLSGMIFPIESMPLFFQWICQFIPAKWFIDAIRKLMIEGLSVRYVLNDLIVLLVMTAIIMGIALKNFNNKLE